MKNRKMGKMPRELFDTIKALYAIHGDGKTYAEYAAMVGDQVGESTAGRVIRVVRAGGGWGEYCCQLDREKERGRERVSAARAQVTMHQAVEADVDYAQLVEQATQETALPGNTKAAIDAAQEAVETLKQATESAQEALRRTHDAVTTIGGAMARVGMALTDLATELARSGLLDAIEKAESAGCGR